MKVEVAGRAVPRLSRREIAAFAQRALEAAGGDIDELSIAFVDDEDMRELNREYRGKDKTTDVLSFTFPEEIVISLDQARRQAREERHSLATEVRYLLVHGILHILGYDHETDQGEMNALELNVRGKVGLD